MSTTTASKQPTFSGQSTWQHFYTDEPSWDALSLEQADQRLVQSNDAKDDHMKVTTPTHTKVLASSQPCEDAVLKGEIHISDRLFELWAVFDGHSGWTTSWKMRKEMLPWLEKYLGGQCTSLDDPDSVVTCIKEAFKAYDDQLFEAALKSLDLVENQDPDALLRGMVDTAPIVAGSCAILCLRDAETSKLYTACTGDSNAILLRPESDEAEKKKKKKKQKYAVHKLCNPQNGSNSDETARVRAEHPDEDPIDSEYPYRVIGGLMPTRAFGDFQYKVTAEQAKAIAKKFQTIPALARALTPPYLTASPEVVVIDLHEGDILIVGSDGLFDHMTDEGTAAAMQAWMDQYSSVSKQSPSSTLPERKGTVATEKYDELDEAFNWYWDDNAIIVEDGNAATHLIRNSLGGKRRELFTMAMSVPPPLRRKWVDDISVHVVFF